MSRSLVFLWVGTAAMRAEHAPDLDSWARSRHVALTAPERTARTPSAYPADVVDRVETLLGEARAAMDGLDDAGAATRLRTAMELLHERPVPQSAWLLAEVHGLEAERVGTTDAAAAGRHLDLARALDGGRVRGFRDRDRAPAPPQDVAIPPPTRIAGLRLEDELFVDGERVSGFAAPRGEHHLRVLRGGQEVHTAWHHLTDQALMIETSAPPPCSTDDLAGVTIEGDRVHVASPVACPNWAIARPGSAGGIDIARCEGTSCRTLLPWRRGDGEDFSGVAQPYPDTWRFPAWLTWTIAGTATALGTSLVLWQAGAFDPAAPGETRILFTAPERPGAR